MVRGEHRPDYREVRQSDLSGGVNNSHNPTIIKPNEASDVLNVEFDRDAVQTTGGSIKFNNQTAPGSAIRTRVDKSLSPLMVLDKPLAGVLATGLPFTNSVDVPLRGYGYIPYCADTDIGGRFDSEGDFAVDAEVFHIRRGRSFEKNVSFLIPPEEKFYESPTKGVNAIATPNPTGDPNAFDPANGFDEALDECFCILQKGGDRGSPMSWALAVVNIGNGVGLGGAGALWPNIPATRPSNYALCWIWLDSAQWAEGTISQFKYNLTTGQHPTSGGGSQFGTQAYRVVLIHKYLEPGRRYSVAVQLQMDTGTPGTTAGGGTNTAWNADGFFKVWVSEEGQAPTSYTYVDSTATSVGLDVKNGPTDSLSYLCRYGIRYAGRDAEFLGLGQRFAPWAKMGFIPFGQDLAPLKSGGFAMVDRTTVSRTDLWGAATATLTVQHNATANAYLVLSHRYMTSGNDNGGFHPLARNNGTTFNYWDALSGNANALRGYRFVAMNDWASYQVGAVMTMLDYVEVGASYRMNILDGGSGRFRDFGPLYPFVQFLRWHQRELVIGQVRTWSAPRDYAATGLLGSRRKLSLHSSIRMDDLTEPDIGTLLSYHPCDDSEGARLRELVVGGLRDGFLCPFGNATGSGGGRGGGMAFLSGEGEAITLDLSEDPTFAREIQRMTAGSTQGFGFEISMVQTEAVNAIGQVETLPNVPGSALDGMRPRLAPDLVSWDVKDATKAGTRVTPRPLLTLGLRNLYSSADPRPFRRPMAFSVAIANASDQENLDQVVPSDLLPWWRDSALATHWRYDPTAPWVGRLVTIQVGVQRVVGSADTYDVYIAMTPKDAFLPANGDPSDAEFAYWTDGAVAALGTPYENNTYFAAAHLTVKRKDLARTVLTVGGRWNCLGKPGDTTNLGYPELNARMLVDEVRWFVTSPAGALPASSGGITSRNGKLEGTNCLPPRLLTSSDMLSPLGEGVRAANVTVGSTTATPPSQTALFTGEAAATQKAIKGAYLVVSGDEVDVPKQETFGLTKPQWYGIDSVASGGASMTLRSAYVDPTRMGAVAGAMRLAGYTAFEDDVRDRPLTLGRGKSYAATGISVADVILTDTFWANQAVPGDGWRLRIYSPLGRSSSAEILPAWTRGLVTERRGPEDGIQGLYGFNGKNYAGVRGAIFEADDRWRAEDFSTAVQWGLAFRGQSLPAGIKAPLHSDMAVLNGASTVSLPETFDDGTVLYIDARGIVESIDEYQTILWLGDPTTDPAALAGTASGAHAFSYALRLNRGRPELVVGSTAFYTGSTRPEKGLFIATAQQAVPVGEHFHVRFYFYTRSTGTIVCKPWCKINGKSAVVRVNATGTGVSGANDWLLVSTLVRPSSASMKLLVGVGRDSYKAADADIAFSAATIQGTLKAPQRLHGYLHSFDGTLADIAVSSEAAWSGSTTGVEPANFDPNAIVYAGTLKLRLLNDPIGVGHRTLDAASGGYADILSHPFVSLYHELGMSSKPVHFTEFGSQLYATNGGKPAVILPDGTAMQAGVVTPTSAPDFDTVRFPLWKQNVRATSGTDDTFDPIRQAAIGASKPNYHYNTVGNAYLRQSLSGADQALMSWVKDGYFHLKGYVRPRSVAGRIQLWRKADGSRSGGPFLDIVDGKVRFGWYDLDLKQEVYVESSGPVFQPNDVHYVNVRKRWPIDDLIEKNWQNSYFSDGRVRRLTMSGTATIAVGEIIQNLADAGPPTKTGLVTKINGVTVEYIAIAGAFAAADQIWKHSTNTNTTRTVSGAPVRPMNDVLQVRRFKRNGEIAQSMNVVPGAFRNLVSLTTNTLTLPTDTNGTGLVSAPGATFTGAAAGVVNASNPAGTLYDVGNVFSSDMVGMYWIWGTGATDAAGSVAGKKYRITAVNTAQQITVIDEELGTSPSFASTSTARQGGVFTGIELRKSDNFDSSHNPDTTQNIIEVMGSSIQGQSTSGFAAFNGEMYSMGWGVTNPAASGTNGQCFETIDTSVAGAAGNDPISTGTDAFAVENYDGTGEPGALQFDSTRQVWMTDGRAYGAAWGSDTSQPQTSLVVTKDPHAPSAAPTSTASSASDPQWTYLQAPSQWSAQRQIAVAFFDKKQNIVGPLSPQLTIKAEGEDAANPSGAVRVRLTNLPVSRADTELWIYESVGDGSSGALFRVAKVENGTAEASIQLSDEETARDGVIADFSLSDVPRCDIVETSGSRLIYGALEIQPDGCVASRPGFPGQVDYSKAFRLNSGFGDRVTGLRDLDGQLVGFKRRAVASISFDANNNAIVQPISAGVGCVAHLTAQAKDGLIVFLSDKGMQVLSRAGITNLGQPQFVGTKVQDFFADSVDQRRFDRAVACLNQKRKQYVVALKLAGETHQNARMSLEPIDEGGIRYSIYSQPNVTALASVQAKGGGTERMIGGTEEGFVCYLDDPRSQQALLGPIAGVWGRSALTIAPLSSTSGMVVDVAPDSTLEGIRGTLVRWVDSADVEHRAIALGSDGVNVHFDEIADAAPVDNDLAVVGSPGYRWTSGWIDMGSPERAKQIRMVNLIMRKQATGTVRVDLYLNLDDTTVIRAASGSDTLDLSKAEHEVEYGSYLAQWFKVSIVSATLAADVSFELASVVWRVQEQEQV